MSRTAALDLAPCRPAQMDLNTEQRKLAAIMFTDMVGYSALAQRDDQLALELLEEHRALLRGLLPGFRGQEIKTIGDAFLVEFGSALEAAQCAIEIQRALAKRNHDVSPDRRIELRIGIHIGDVVHRGGDVYGDGVNIASRIEPLAGAGGICVSMDVERQIRNALEARFEKLGAAELKNIKLPMELFRIVLPWETGTKAPHGAPAARKRVGLLVAAPIVVAALFLAWILVERPGRQGQGATTPQTNPAPAAVAATVPAHAPASKSIAVLPFANLSGEKDSQFFTDGVHEDLLTALAKVHDLKVISRTSVLIYRDAATRNLKQIAADLDVAQVVEGSVRRSGNQARITVQLIDARTDQHLWAETYDRDLTNVFAVQSEVAREITTALRANLTADERSLIAERPTQNQEAYDLFARARALHQSLGNQDDRARYEEVIGLYEQAVAKDPGFAQAWGRLSIMHGFMYWFGHLDPSPPRAEQAKTALDTTVKLAPGRPETRLAQGVYYYRVLNDWPRARTEFLAADADLPNDAQVLHWLGLTERRLGRYDAALGFLERSAALNPLDMETALSRIELLSAHRRYADACAQARRLLVMFPDRGEAAAMLADAQLELDGDVAAWAGRMMALPQTGQNLRGLRSAYLVAMRTGNYQEADRVLSDPQKPTLPFLTTVMSYPDTLHQALVEFLRGDRVRSQERADAAMVSLRAGHWSPRQESSVSMGLALAHALAGRSEEAAKLARAAYEQARVQDAYEAMIKLDSLGQIYALLDRREEALGCLREMMGAPDSIPGPQAVRHSFGWSRLANDPQFEEILKLAKPQ